MHLQRIHFDKVFDVQSRIGMFSFTSGDAVTYGVHLPTGTIPQQGATWVVAFKEPGNWSTLLGWRDLAAQRTTLTYKIHHVLLGEAWFIYWIALPALALTLFAGGPWVALALGTATVAGGIWMLRHVVLRNRRVRAALRKTCITPPASPC